MSHTYVIWGAGGHGKVIADVIRAQFGDVLLEYVERDSSRLGETCEPGGGKVTRDEETFRADLEAGLEHPVVLAVGNNRARLEMYVRVVANGGDLPTLVHPTASVSPSAELGPGTHVVTGAIVHPGARVGAAVILNTGCIIEHDCVIGDGCHVSPGAVLAGGVHVGARSWIGAGATVINNVRVGSDVTVGAGAVVIDDVPDGATVVGVPARRTD